MNFDSIPDYIPYNPPDDSYKLLCESLNLVDDLTNDITDQTNKLKNRGKNEHDCILEVTTNSWEQNQLLEQPWTTNEPKYYNHFIYDQEPFQNNSQANRMGHTNKEVLNPVQDANPAVEINEWVVARPI